MAWRYILECSDGSYCVGSTINLEQRLIQHQEGEGGRTTSRRLPVKLVYSEEYEKVYEAYAREKQVQNWSRAKREALINGEHADLPKYAKRILDVENKNRYCWSSRRCSSAVSRPTYYFDIKMDSLDTVERLSRPTRLSMCEDS